MHTMHQMRVNATCYFMPMLLFDAALVSCESASTDSEGVVAMTVQLVHLSCNVVLLSYAAWTHTSQQKNI